MADPPLIAVVGDVHARMALLDTVLERVASANVDGLLLVGDLACAGLAGRQSAEDLDRYCADVDAVLDRVRALGRPMLFVPGNHDLPVVDRPENVDGRQALLCGLSVAGIGGAGPARFGFSYEWGEHDVRAREVPACDVLVSHTPPRNTPLDLTSWHNNAGSAAVGEIALDRARVLVCGHIHEAAGVYRLGDCLCLNAGSLGAPFGRAQVGFVRGTDEVWHEDLTSGQVRRLAR